jgi:hypothetical protein
MNNTPDNSSRNDIRGLYDFVTEVGRQTKNPYPLSFQDFSRVMQKEANRRGLYDKLSKRAGIGGTYEDFERAFFNPYASETNQVEALRSKTFSRDPRKEMARQRALMDASRGEYNPYGTSEVSYNPDRRMRGTEIAPIDLVESEDTLPEIATSTGLKTTRTFGGGVKSGLRGIRGGAEIAVADLLKGFGGNSDDEKEAIHLLNQMEQDGTLSLERVRVLRERLLKDLDSYTNSDIRFSGDYSKKARQADALKLIEERMQRMGEDLSPDKRVVALDAMRSDLSEKGASEDKENPFVRWKEGAKDYMRKSEVPEGTWAELGSATASVGGALAGQALSMIPGLAPVGQAISWASIGAQTVSSGGQAIMDMEDYAAEKGVYISPEDKATISLGYMAAEFGGDALGGAVASKSISAISKLAGGRLGQKLAVRSLAKGIAGNEGVRQSLSRMSEYAQKPLAIPLAKSAGRQIVRGAVTEGPGESLTTLAQSGALDRVWKDKEDQEAWADVARQAVKDGIYGAWAGALMGGFGSAIQSGQVAHMHRREGLTLVQDEKNNLYEVIGSDQSSYLVLDRAGRQKMLPADQVVDAIHYTPEERQKAQKAYDEATEGLHPKEEVLTENQKRAGAILSATEQQQSPIYRATHPEIAEEDLNNPVALAGAKQALADVLEGQNEEVKARVDQMALVLKDGEADPTEELTKLFSDESLSDNDRQSILDVVTAQSRLSTIERSHQEAMAQMQSELTKEWSAKSVVGDETARGAVISATITDADGKPKQVYVTGGVRVVTNEDGTVELLPTDDNAPIYVYDESVEGDEKGHIVQMDDLSSPQLVAEDYLDLVQASIDEAETAFRSEVQAAEEQAPQNAPEDAGDTTDDFMQSLPRTREGEVDGLKLMSERPDDFIRYLGQLYGEDFVASLPLSKSGALDLKALTPEQTLSVNEAALGKSGAVEAARQRRSKVGAERSKLEAEVKSDLGNLEKRMALRKASEEYRLYDDYVRAAEEQARQELEAQKRSEEEALTPEERQRREEEKRQLAQAKKEREERIRLENERRRREREELERNAEGSTVREYTEDPPRQARARGARLVNGAVVYRQEPMTVEHYADAERAFSQRPGETRVPVKRTIVEAESLQASHKEGQMNPRHFIPEAQPKDRADNGLSSTAADRIASDIRPDEITGGITAYTGAPVVNGRGEVIQGNNRTDALQTMYDGAERHAKSAERYREYLKAHASEYGMTVEQVDAMAHPVAVDVAEVSDSEAIRLGHRGQTDLESAGADTMNAQTVGEELNSDTDPQSGQSMLVSFFNRIFNRTGANGAELSAKMDNMLNRNAEEGLKFLLENGYITDTQYKNAFETNSEGKHVVTAEAKTALKDVALYQLADVIGPRAMDIFYRLPASARNGLATFLYRDSQASFETSLAPDLGDALLVWDSLRQDPDFAGQTNFESAKIFILGKVSLFGRSELETNLGEASSLAKLLAASMQTQTEEQIAVALNKYYDLVGANATGAKTQSLMPTSQPTDTKAGAAEAVYGRVYEVPSGREKHYRFRRDVAEDFRTRRDALADRITEERRKHAAAMDMARTFGVPMKLHEDMSTLPEEVRAGFDETHFVKGWFYKGDNAIHIYLPANVDADDVRATFLHEAVGHYGCRELLGEVGYNQVLDGIANKLGEEEVLRAMKEYCNGSQDLTDLGQVRIAMDEWIAHRAESGITKKTVWESIKDFFRKVFGLSGKQIDQSAEMMADDLLRRSAENLQKSAETQQATSPERAPLRMSGEGVTPKVSFSDERDQNGHRFVKASNGSMAFGEVGEETGLQTGEIRLSEGFQNDKSRTGYGMLHMEANHGEEIRKAGFSSVRDFVEYVGKGYQEIRKGTTRDGGGQTYLIELPGDHNNTLFIECVEGTEGDKTYWNVNSGGVFRKGYSDKKAVVWSVPALGDNVSTDTAKFGTSSEERTKSENAMSGNSSQTTALRKDTESTDGEQPKGSEQRFRQAERDGDVSTAAEAASDFFHNATPKNTTIDNVLRFKRVYHNSPHLLKKADGAFVDPETGERLGFDHRFMGSGEGAQSHGWGSYFGVKDLDWYAPRQDLLAPDGFKFIRNSHYVTSHKGTSYTSRILFNLVRRAYNDGLRTEKEVRESVTDRIKQLRQESEKRVKMSRRLLEAIKKKEAWALSLSKLDKGEPIVDNKTGYTYVATFFPEEEAKTHYDSSRKAIKQYDDALTFISDNPDFIPYFVTESNESGRHKYIVEIPDPSAFEYIQERKHLSDKTKELVLQAMKEDPLPTGDISEHTLSRVNGRAFYDLLRKAFETEGRSTPDNYNKAKQAASEWLSRAGIVGIHYYGRIDGECYVIFNDKDAKITDHIRFRREEREKIRKDAIADGTWMKAPNGENSNLSERDWVTVRTTAFKDWFGDWEDKNSSHSLIVDSNGEPLPVYHYTSEDFTVFDRSKARKATDVDGFFFAPSHEDWSAMGDKLITAFLNIRRPAINPVLALGQTYDAGVKERLRLEREGYDGIINGDSEEGIEYVAFYPNQIKRTDGEAFSPNSDDIRFRRKKAHLAGVHTLTTDNLRHALKMGGLANPSLAVYDTERGLSTRTFGEVALIAPRDLVDANTGRHKGTYNRDSWSPVYPRIAYDLTENGHDLMRELDKKRGEREGSLYALHNLVMEEPKILDKDYFIKLLSVDQQIKELYRSEAPSIPFDQYVEKIAEPILKEKREMLYAGQNPDGSKRYVPHTLENVSKVMNEDFSKIAPWDLFMESLVDLSEKYKSLESIRRHEDRIAGMDDSLYKKVENEFHNLAEELVSDKPETMYPAEPAKKLQALIVNNDNRYGRPLTVTEEARVSALREQMKALPTDYFETKVDRPVGLSEFVEAVVPEGTSSDLVTELEKSGLNVSTYDNTKEGAMNEAVLSAMDRADATNRGVRFRTGEQNIEDMTPATGGGLSEALRYVRDKKEALDWFGIAPPKGASAQANPKLSDIASVINGFENPKIEKATHTDPNLRFRMAERAGDVSGAAEVASDFMRNATPKDTSVDDVLRFLRVYHNSPHLLKKADGAFVDPDTGERLGFDHRFIGNGEGYQAHGWGSYFSVNDLEGYASPNDEVYDGIRLTQNDAYVTSRGGSTNIASILFQTIRTCWIRNGSIASEKAVKKGVGETLGRIYQKYEQIAREEERLLEALKDNEPWAVTLTSSERESTVTDPKTGYEYAPRTFSVEEEKRTYKYAQRQADRYKAALLFTESNPDYVRHFETKVTRHKYTVEIPDPDTNHYIKEDRRVTKREAEMIRDAINNNPETKGSPLADESWRGRKWVEAYELLSRRLGGEDRASSLLNKAGFVGIHYNGRIDGECYVIFNENDAKITDHIRFRRAERAAEAASDFMRNATPKNSTVDDVLRFLRVYHNSPHLLKKADGSFVEPETGERLGFDHRFMGSGEGAQAHGWGSYFSVKDLADYASTYDPSVYHGMRITQNDEYVISNGGNAKTSELLFETVYGLCKSYETAPDEDAIKRYVIETITSRFQEHQQEANRQRRLLDALKDNEPWAVTVTNAQTGDIITDPKTGYRYSEEDSSVDYVRWRYEISKKMEGRYGKVLSFIESNPDYVEHFVAKVERHKYAVEIPDPSLYEYINERESLSDKAKDLLFKAMWEDPLPLGRLDPREVYGVSGGDIYRSIARQFQRHGNPSQKTYIGSRRAASEWLSRAGFVGIHYNGRRDGECYVIFNENDARITDHYRFRRTERAGDVSGAAEAAGYFVRNATPKNTTIDDVLRFKRVYHNSPHLLKKADGAFVDPETGERLGFDHRFMGSGEGAQAHGWGSYFSVKDLEGYGQTDQLTPYDGMPEMTISKDDLSRYSDEQKRWAEMILDLYNDGEGDVGNTFISPLERLYADRSAFEELYDRQKDASARWDDFVDFYKNRLDEDVRPFHNKYVVEIPNLSDGSYLEEDAPLSENQTSAIKQTMEEKSGSEYDESFYSDFANNYPEWNTLSGGKLYKTLSDYILKEYTDSLSQAAQWTSEMLNEAGFVGIHYNGQRDGECYVIFNEKDAKITDHVRFRRTERTDPKSMSDPINPQWDGEWYSPEDLTGKSTADLLDLPAAPATPEKLPTQSVAEYAETMSRHYADPRVRFRTGSHKESLRAPQPPRITDGMSLYEVAQLQHEYNRNYRDYLSSSMKRMDALVTTKGRFIRYMVDSARPVELFCKEMERMGIGMTPEQNIYQDMMTQSSRELNMRKQEVEPLVTKLTDRIRDLREQKLLDKVMDVSYTFKDKDTEKTESVKRADGYDKVSLYFQAKDIVECEQLGLVSRGREGFEDVVTEFGKPSNHITPEAYIASFEASVGKANAEALCDDMRKMSRWSIDRLHGAGLMTDDQYRNLTQSPRRYYAPQRGFKITEESDRNAYERVEMTAEGRQSLSGDPIAYIQAIMNTTVMRVVRNQDLLHLYEWVTQHQQELARRGVLEIGETYYRKSGVDEKGNPMYIPSKESPTIEELRHDADARRKIAKLRMEQKRLDQSHDKGETTDYVYGVKSKEISNKISDLNNSIEILYRDPTPLRGDENEQDEALRRTVKVYKDGVEQQIHFSPQYRGELVADVLNGRPSMDKNTKFYRSVGRYLEKAGAINLVSKATRFMSALMTQYNPNFAVTNALRDYGTALISNVSDFGWAYQRDFMANYAKVQKTVLKYAMSDAYSDGTYPSGKYGTYLKEFFDEGAATGWSFLPDVVKIRQTMKEMSDPSLKQKFINGKFGVANAFGLKQGIGMITEASELNTRFAEYVTSRERGYSKKEAAKHAKELTVNFNRKGTLAGVFGSFFGFWNASIQGTNKIVRLGKPAAAWCGTLFAGGLAQGLLYAIGAPDKDDERAFTEWEMMTNLCMGDVKIPLPQGFRGFWGAGVQMALAIAGKKDWQGGVIDGMQYLVGELLPNEAASLSNIVEWDDVTGNVEFNKTKVLRDIMPTAIQPVTDVRFNMNFMGNSVYHEPFVKTQEGQIAQRTLAKKRTKQVYKDIADAAWYAMGGSLERNDRMSRDGTHILPDDEWLNPSVIEHVFEGYTTGIGKTLTDIATCVSAASNGDPSELRKLQIVNVLTKQEKDYSDSDQSYWKLMDFYRSRQQTMSNLRKAKEGEDFERYREMTKRVSELAPRMTGEQLTEKIWEDGTQDEKLYVTWLETKALLKQIDKGTVTKEEVAPTIDRLTEQFRELR